MIGKAKAIPHGISYLRYQMGESANKRHPEKIDYICSQHLPLGLDASGVWESMQASLAGCGNMKNSLIRIELSPSKEYTGHFQFRDWEKLWKEFVAEFDRQTIKDKDGNVTSLPTNIAGSKGVVYLHKESKGEIPHLHGGICRVDEEGNVNNDHDIHLRVQRAAEAVARRRGWTTAMNVRLRNVDHIASVCEEVLKNMPRWSWDDYVARIEKEGYLVKARTDSQGNVKGYAIICGKAKYKASGLGKGRSLTYSRLAATWQFLHPVTVLRPEERPVLRQPVPNTKVTTVQPPKVAPRERVMPRRETPPQKQESPVTRQPLKIDYTSWAPNRNPVDIEIDGTNHHLYLPKAVLRLFDDAFDYRAVENWRSLTNLARAYFAALLAPDVAVSVGGGSSDNNGWGREKDEDELAFARRCAQMAKSKLGVTKKSRGFHR